MKQKQVIVVTGSSKGIGAGLVSALAQQGHCVVINYAHSDKEADDLFEELAVRAGDRVMKVKADVSSRSAVRSMFDQVVENFGRVDALINNAGINIDCPFVEMRDQDWEQVISTILTGTFICSQEFVFHFEGAKGSLINIGAPTAIHGRANGANYCSAKAGIIALTKCLARELAPRIRVNCVIPDLIETDEVRTRFHLDDSTVCKDMISVIPMGRLGTPDDVIAIVNYLLDGADHTTGHNFFVDGGRYM